MRRFHLIRKVDESGVSGTGHVASGVQLPSGRCVMEWLTDLSSIAIYDDVETLIKIHGHGGKTRLFWCDRADRSA